MKIKNIILNRTEQNRTEQAIYAQVRVVAFFNIAF